jgi:hypothetical protein
MFSKDKIDYNKIIMSTQNNWILVVGSAKQRKAQIFVMHNQLLRN